MQRKKPVQFQKRDIKASVQMAEQKKPEAELHLDEFYIWAVEDAAGNLPTDKSKYFHCSTIQNESGRLQALYDEIKRIQRRINYEAGFLESFNIKHFDACHVVAASIAKVDYFITVDDRLLRRYSTENLELRFNFKMLKPDDFLLELQKWN